MKPTEETPLIGLTTTDLILTHRSGACDTHRSGACYTHRSGACEDQGLLLGRTSAIAIVLASVIFGSFDGTAKHILLAQGVPPTLSAAVGSLLRGIMLLPALLFVAFLAGQSCKSYKKACKAVFFGHARDLFRWAVAFDTIAVICYSLANSYETQPGVVALLLGTSYIWSAIFEVALGLEPASARILIVSLMACAAMMLIVCLPMVDREETYVPSLVGCTLAGMCGLGIAGVLSVYRLAAIRSSDTVTAMPLAGTFGSLLAALGNLILLLLDPQARAAAAPFFDRSHTREEAIFWSYTAMNSFSLTLYSIGLAVGAAYISSFTTCVLVLSEFIWAPLLLGIFVGTWPVLLTIPGMLLLAAVTLYVVWVPSSTTDGIEKVKADFG